MYLGCRGTSVCVLLLKIWNCEFHVIIKNSRCRWQVYPTIHYFGGMFHTCISTIHVQAGSMTDTNTLLLILQANWLGTAYELLKDLLYYLLLNLLPFLVDCEVQYVTSKRESRQCMQCCSCINLRVCNIMGGYGRVVMWYSSKWHLNGGCVRKCDWAPYAEALKEGSHSVSW